MQNLEQIRAAAALPAALHLKRSAISKLPGLILNNGLLAASAFCDAPGGGNNRPDQARAIDAVAIHLAARGIVGNQVNTIQLMIRDLSARDSLALQRATSEALAFLSYLKRFATND
jgi:CRISPR/Cas system CMR-associated protein Cmr5 small subunit